MSEQQPQPLPDGVRLMSGYEAIVIMQRLMQRAKCPIKLNPNMTMAGALQLIEHWCNNMDERDRVLGAPIVQTLGVKP
jgi:hypothetical protein